MLVELIAKRLQVAKSIGRYKDIGGLPIRNLAVEEIVLARTGKKGKASGLSIDFVKSIFQQLIEESVNIQETSIEAFKEPILEPFLDDHIDKEKPMRIAFQGEFGAYSHLCLTENFVNSEAVPCHSFREIFNRLNQNIEFALLPIENSLGGTIQEVFQLLEQSDVNIVKEILFRVEHSLIATHNDFSKITTAISHPEALKQCLRYLKMRKIQPKEFSDTAGAVRYLAENKGKQVDHIAAIASKQAADLYNLPILKHQIQDNTENYTRFLLITKKT